MSEFYETAFLANRYKLSMWLINFQLYASIAALLVPAFYDFGGDTNMKFIVMGIGIGLLFGVAAWLLWGLIFSIPNYIKKKAAD